MRSEQLTAKMIKETLFQDDSFSGDDDEESSEFDESSEKIEDSSPDDSEANSDGLSEGEVI